MSNPMTPALDVVRREELKKRAEAAHVHGWRCPFCNCQTFARFDELGQHGYAPGDDVRCVSCKHESYWPRFNETADTTLALLAYIAELEAGLGNLLEVLEPAEHPARRDPIYGDEVEALGLRIGFGALMSSASASWREAQLARDGFSGGEFVAGPCYAVLTKFATEARALLPKASVREERGRE